MFSLRFKTFYAILTHSCGLLRTDEITHFLIQSSDDVTCNLRVQCTRIELEFEESSRIVRYELKIFSFKVSALFFKGLSS